MINADMIIHGAHVITMEGAGTGVINNGAVVITGNRITAVGETADILKEYTADRMISGKDKAVMPGFVDAHMHTGDTIVRSCAQDMPGELWRIRGILPLLGMAEDEDYVAGSRINIIEALKSGTTTFGDFYSPMSAMVQNYAELGVRACVSEMINELPPDIMEVELGTLIPFDSAVGDRKLRANIDLVEKWHGRCGGRITCRFGAHSTEYCSPELLREIKAQADRYGVGRYTHLSQSEEENFQTVLRNGVRPVELLEKLGWLDRNLVAAHMSYATSEELAKVAKSGTAMVLCSGSNALIEGILPPALEFMKYGGTCSLATDQANNCNFMFSEIKIAAMLCRHETHDCTSLPAWKLLRMATIEGAKALRMEDQIGSLRAGKLADLIMIDLSYPHLNPIYDGPVRNLIPNLAYSARGHEVEMVMVDGKIIVEDHQLLTASEKDAVAQANAAAARVAGRLVKQEWTSELPLVRMTNEGYY